MARWLPKESLAGGRAGVKEECHFHQKETIAKMQAPMVLESTGHGRSVSPLAGSGKAGKKRAGL